MMKGAPCLMWMQKMKRRDILERAMIHLSFIVNDSFKDSAFVVAAIVREDMILTQTL